MAETSEAAAPTAWLLSAGSGKRVGSIASAAATARAIVGGMAGIEQSHRHRAVDQPGVEVAQAIVGGEPPAERPLARGRRPVDGDDHEKSAPRARIKAEKPGKLVAIMAASSTRTGFSLAKPMTRNAMAMRWSMWVVTVPPPDARPLPCTIRSSPSISMSTPLAA